MAFNDNQPEFPLPAGNEGKRQSEQHLPRYFRTQVNSKFLSSTLDQILQPGVAEKLNGYIGRKISRAFKESDNYIGDISKSREDYQFEPAAVIKDELNNVEFYKDYNDYINQIANFRGTTSDHSLLNSQEFYAWDPHIDWDKFVNFREYYWLPTGPQSVPVRGQTVDIVSTYSVTLTDNLDNYGYVFSPDGLTQNPSIKLYRGINYRFDINTPGLPFTIRTKRTLDDSFLLNSGISAQNIETGIIELTLDAETPDILYYVADNDINTAGLIKVANIEEATFIDIETEILGKKTYRTSNNFELSNGMKVYFTGEVVPASYAEGEYYVEGVGDKIQLVPEDKLNVSSSFTQDLLIEFDAQGFDRLPFDEAIGYPAVKDYLVINRASQDGNLWSRYNRWFHRDVIEKSAQINSQEIDVDQDQRAKRPIIEFEAGLKLHNFGTFAKADVDLIDNFTKDVFSTIEGSVGYNIDGIDVTDGMRILFIADPDVLVKGKIFEVNFINFSSGRTSNRQISLIEVSDTDPLTNEVVLVKNGNAFKGKLFYYTGTEWKLTQDKNSVNQAPLFDIFDDVGNSYANTTTYEASTFNGNKVFSYTLGSGAADSELGFALSYRNIENVGDITFSFDLLSGSFNFTSDNDLFFKNTDIGYLRKYNSKDAFETVNGWKKSNELSNQAVLRQYVFDNTQTSFAIDVYEQSGLIEDLWIRVYLNNTLQFENVDYTIRTNQNSVKEITFSNDLNLGDVIVIKTRSSAVKTENGLYEIASNFERNPLNNNLKTFTLGEVNDHVGTIVEQIEGFSGNYPGNNNLRDLGPKSQYGRRFVKHSSPLNLSLYHLLDKDANIIKSLRYAKREYSKFKRTFLQVANDLGYDGPIKDHVDKIMKEIIKDKVQNMPFYFSDMVPTGAATRNQFDIEDEQQIFFALSTEFNLLTPSRKAAQIYLNGTQLTHGKDYIFNSDGFAVVTASKVRGDILEIYEYETTNGSYVPPTPTKLGLYPAYEPQIYVDNTYQVPTKIIQGHDGSRYVAYDDFRDNLILELEKRIYNNIKISYNTDLLDVHSFVPGVYRSTGFTQKQINDSMIADFVQWLTLVNSDYTVNSYFERSNTFTFNYKNTTANNGTALSGFWRNVYKQAFDTDRPHTHPWEMLGFSVKPTWWEEQYGPAPYTKDNLLLWEDLEKGIVRQPGRRFVVNKKYIRTGLTTNIPVDESGNLLSPNDCGFVKNYTGQNIQDDYVFGDHSPVETAWRNSSEYPFALITAWVLNQPNKIFATGFDRFRQIKNAVGQIVYSQTKNHFRLEDIVFPNQPNDSTQVFTSGLINYIVGYLASNVTTPFDEYKDRIVRIQNQVGFKLGGFTDKSKFKLILDSRTPLNQGNVFVPEENYNIFLNTSSATQILSYSGVLIEKQPSGFVIKGYDQTDPVFKYLQAITLDNDPVINIGGVSESFVTWSSGKFYNKGSNVEFNGNYYRVTASHNSTQSFDDTKFAKLPNLPLIGGREAVFRRRFSQQNIIELPYGTTLRTLQEVVDFLLGYGEYLKSLGFVFDFFDDENQVVADWKTSAKEFLFWTTQNWSAGSILALSPAGFRLKLNTEYNVVDNIFDAFYGYTLLQADGTKLVEEFSSLARQNPNEFILKTKNTDNGIYAVKLPLVQKEHVVLLDNNTVFGDTIFDLEPGYRQERIRVLGYRTIDWDGSLNIPGFIYDNAKITDWEPWQDYAIGDLVKYKEFFYAANLKVPGSETFNSSQWNRLSEKPEAKLLPNFEYKTNQFADFYDLDTDNFDTEQQKFAQHLIGYQNRNYLANIINDDVSQYKFYQGMILEKGTRNALDKLFDVLSSANQDSLDFYEEWAIKSGQYGAAEGFDEVEFLLDESKFRLEPQPIELVDRIGEETDLVYRIRPYEVYLKPNDYNHAPFPSKFILEGYTKNSGYVNPEDVQFIVSTYNDILTINYSDCKNKNYIWVGNEDLSWNVYQHTATDVIIESLVAGENEFTISCTSTPSEFAIGDIIGIYDLISTDIDYADSSYTIASQSTANIGKFYQIKNIVLNRITLSSTDNIEDIENCFGRITKLVSVRAANLNAVNAIAELYSNEGDIYWVDDDSTGKWTVIKNNQAFDILQEISNTTLGKTQNYGVAIAANSANTYLAVGAPDDDDGKVYIYRRGSSGNNYQLIQTIDAITDFAASQRFGASIAMSEDGQYLIIGSPNATNVKTKFKNDYLPTNSYAIGDIVSYQNGLWQALNNILPQVASINFSSFDSVVQIIDTLNIAAEISPKIPVLLTGSYPLPEVQTSHMLVRAPADMYEGSDTDDIVQLVWNTKTIGYQDQLSYVDREPFNGAFAPITSSFLTGDHTIKQKIDNVLYVDTVTNIPSIGSRVETADAFGTVVDVYENEGSVSLYLNNINGNFDIADSLFTADGDFVGEYERVAPTETIDTSNSWGGYWLIETPTYTTGQEDSSVISLSDEGRGLIYKDVITELTADSTNKYYYNILDYNTTIISSENTLNSYIRVLSSEGAPGPGGTSGTFLDSRFVIRAPKDLTDILTPNDEFDFYMPTLQRFVTGDKNDPTVISLTYADLNKELVVDDLWDGYIFFEFTKFDGLGNPFEPRIGDTVRDVTTGATAEVAFYQRDGLNVTIFVKNVTGNWSQGDDYGNNAEIEFLGTPGDPSPIYAVNRVMGQIQFRSLGLAAAGIGKLIVIDTGTDIQLAAQDILLDTEYWFYNENVDTDTIQGIARPANIPDEDNNDWRQVFSIPAAIDGVVSGLSNEGMYSVYFRGSSVNYSFVNAYTVPERTNNLYLGTDVKIGKIQDLYRGFISVSGTASNASFDGRIYVVNQGTDSTGQTWNWEYAKDKQFKGAWSSLVNYYTDDIVYRGEVLYRALTNISAGAFVNSDWIRIEEPLDYVGYMPNDTAFTPVFDSADDTSTILDQGGIINFGTEFDISSNGEVLVTIANYSTAKPNVAVIYRALGGNFQRSQTLSAPNNTIGFGNSVAISADGTMIAIGAPFDDQVQLDQGTVFVYKQTNGSFELIQTLRSRTNEKNEQFGYTVQFDGNTLAVCAKVADGVEHTTFEEGLTFDGGFTQFKRTYIDSGVVHLYQRINDVLVFGQTIDYDDSTVFDFGKHMLANNNHIYIGLPRVETSTGRAGTVVDYRRLQSKQIWENLRQSKDTVDIDKIKRVILYDTKTNQLIDYLDYIDPIQGKIAGPADQEIRYKMYTDPAVYTTAPANLTVNTTNSWGRQQIGQVWWDLTNAKFLNAYQGNAIFSSSNWNTLFRDNTIDVYEWVESTLTPAQWAVQADTEQGIQRGISGTPRYNNSAFVQKRVYDSVAQRFTNLYYFWVQNKKTVPNIENRNLSVANITALIAAPQNEGYRFINFISPTSFVLHNCDRLIKGRDVALSVQYWTIENQNINIHNEYKIITEGLGSSKPSRDIERKWFDSLVGYDSAGRSVPGMNLSPKEKYGILNKPRQTWFINRIEALKQVIDRTNNVLRQNLLADDKDFSRLFENDPLPSAISRIFDTSVDTLADLEFVGVARARQAILRPVIENGKIIRVDIVDSGRGYLVAPTYTISGTGADAEIEFTINSVGAITNVTVVNQGSNYSSSNTNITVRKFTVLVKNDESILGKWALYERNTETRTYTRIVSQAYDVRLFWDYIDWYASGYNELNDIDFLIEETYQLQSLQDNTGDIIKINNVGTGGWLLLEKISNEPSVDYTVNYKTIGRQNGTIQFKNALYDYVTNSVGFDGISYDVKFYDSEPTIETRTILETIRDDLFVDELEIEYNKLFFASLRYVFSEQSYVDWAFKTSFIKAKHNVGQLRQDITFNNDNLPSYEAYLNEVKPYKTKLREYVSDYEKLDNSANVVADFDLQPSFNQELQQILPKNIKIRDNQLVGADEDLQLQTYPYKNWLDNFTYKLVAINVKSGGTGYTFPPVITITGGGGSGAAAIAYLGRNGEITNIEIINPGIGYTSAPAITINGSQTDGSEPAVLAAQLGDGLVRSFNTTVKFDRTTGVYHITKIRETQNFAGTGSKYLFNLTWPMDLRTTTIEVVVNNEIALSGEYTYRNQLDTSKGYDRYHGVIEFNIPPSNGAAVVINYNKSIDLLQAQDRINLIYDPKSGQFAKDLGQLMDGIDYGGVEVKSFTFGGLNGWDTDAWYTGNWDVYDNTYDDQIFILDGSTLALDLYTPLENSVVYNIYKNGIRIDDPNFDSSPTNPNALMPSITGNGTQQTINLGDFDIPANAGDTFIVRKIDSDGSFLPDPQSYDTIIEGGNLAYSTATGLNPEEINIDGDSFVTATTSKGPEELVPGQVLDAVDITVYERPTTGASNIYTRNYIGDGSTKIYTYGDDLITNESLFVKVNYKIIDGEDYTIDSETQSISFNTAPANGARINLTWLDISGENILDIDSFVSDGSTVEFLSNVRWTNNISYIVTINGTEIPSVILESDNSYEYPGNVLIRLAEPALEGTVVRYALFTGAGDVEKNFSQVTIDSFIADGSTTSFALTQTPFSQEPSQAYTLVKVNDSILYAGYNQKFVVSATRQYQLDRWQTPVGSIDNWDLEVYLNGRKLTHLREWSFLGGGEFDSSLNPDQQQGSVVELAAEVGTAGDELQVFVRSDGEYRYGLYETLDDSSNSFTDTPGVLHLDSAYNPGDTITVYQFSNNSSQNIDRANYFVVERTTLTVGTDDYYQLRRLRNGLVDLREEAVDSQYVWVIVNGVLLNPNVDYRVTENKRYVQIINGLNENDIVETFHFANVPLKNKFGWRQFKDILNRNHYKRLDGTKNFRLRQNLNWYDKNIVLVDATNLPAPPQGTKQPGVIWIDGERIEYFIKEGNVLKHLRRGTLGTGVKEFYDAGTELYDQSGDQTMPYRDETLTTIFTADGTTNNYELDFTPNSVNDFEVFVAGRRLRKNTIQSYQFEQRDANNNVTTNIIAQDSPEGDITLAPEFTIAGNTLTLANTPSENLKVIVVRKQGKLWTEPGTPLSSADTDIARFLRAAQVDLPR